MTEAAILCLSCATCVSTGDKMLVGVRSVAAAGLTSGVGAVGGVKEFDLDRGCDLDRSELALDRGCRPPGDGDGGMRTLFETAYQSQPHSMTYLVTPDLAQISQQL